MKRRLLALVAFVLLFCSGCCPGGMFVKSSRTMYDGALQEWAAYFMADQGLDPISKQARYNALRNYRDALQEAEK